MSASQQFSVILSAEMADIVERKVKSGTYRSASDVMRDGLLALVERDEALERWLREDVVTGHIEYLADTSKAIPASEVLDRIRSQRRIAKA